MLVQERDTLTDGGLAAYLGCLHNGCQQEACHVYELPPNFVGRVYIGANPFTQLNIMAWQNCNFMRLDTCQVVGDILFAPFVIWFDFPTNTQIVVCGPLGHEVDVFIKSHETKDTLRLATIKVDTLCGALIGIDDPIIEEYEVVGYVDLLGRPLGRNLPIGWVVEVRRYRNYTVGKLVNMK